MELNDRKEKRVMKFEVLYRRILHAELDTLLDVSETVRRGPYEYQDAKALAERTSRKWAMDSLLMAAIVAPYGKDRVIESLNKEIAQYRRMIEIRRGMIEMHDATMLKEDSQLIANYERTIALIEETIVKL